MLPSPNEQTLTTANGGAGALHFEISRGAPFVDGGRFDVQWRLEGNDGSILQSACFTVTVKWPCTAARLPVAGGRAADAHTPLASSPLRKLAHEAQAMDGATASRQMR